MIVNAAEYEKAHSDLRILEQRIADLEREHPIGEKGFTKAGVRKMIAKIDQEIAAFVQASVREGFAQLDEGRSVPAAEVFAKAKDRVERAQRAEASHKSLGRSARHYDGGHGRHPRGRDTGPPHAR